MANEREPQKQVDDSEFMDIAKDPAEARGLRKTLEQLADGIAGDVVKEMAQEVLAGRISLRDAVAVSAYSDALVEQAQPFREKWEQLSDTEREALAAEGERQLEEQRREIAAERREQGSGPGRRSRHDGSGWSL